MLDFAERRGAGAAAARVLAISDSVSCGSIASRTGVISKVVRTDSPFGRLKSNANVFTRLHGAFRFSASGRPAARISS